MPFWKRRRPDFLLSNEKSIILLTPMTDIAKAWIKENVEEQSFWFGSALVVEHRYIADMLRGIEDKGLTWEELKSK